jgi:hypothetical protein
MTKCVVARSRLPGGKYCIVIKSNLIGLNWFD